MRLITRFLLLGCALASRLYAQSAFGPSLFAGYSLQRVNAGPGQCGCFFLNGGEAELALPTTHALGGVVDFSGHTTSTAGDSISGLSVLTLVAGPRLEIGLGRQGKSSHLAPFAEVLAGASHGFHSYFPTPGGPSSATAFALVTGGGLALNLSRPIALRPAQLD